MTNKEVINSLLNHEINKEQAISLLNDKDDKAKQTTDEYVNKFMRKGVSKSVARQGLKQGMELVFNYNQAINYLLADMDIPTLDRLTGDVLKKIHNKVATTGIEGISPSLNSILKEIIKELG